MSSPAVEVENLTKIFRLSLRREYLVAVQNLSFTVGAGEVYGLIGPNGSGKSTTMKVILGLMKATRGSTSIFGIDSRDMRSRNRVGFLPENPYFYKHLSGKETLQFYGKLCGLKKGELRERTAELLAMVDLGGGGESSSWRIFQGHAAKDRTGTGLDSETAVGDPRRTDSRRGSGWFEKNPRLDSRVKGPMGSQ